MADSRQAYAAPAQGPPPTQFRLLAPGVGLPQPASHQQMLPHPMHMPIMQPPTQQTYVAGPGYGQFSGFRYPPHTNNHVNVIVQHPQHHIPSQLHGQPPPHQLHPLPYGQRHQFPAAAGPPPRPPLAQAESSESAARCSGFFVALLNRSRTGGSAEGEDRWRHVSNLVRSLIAERIDAGQFVSQLKLALNSQKDPQQLVDFLSQHLPEFRLALRQGRARLDGLAPQRAAPQAPLQLAPSPQKPPTAQPSPLPAAPVVQRPPEPPARPGPAAVLCPTALRLRLLNAARSRGLPDAAESAAVFLAAAVERRLLDLLEGAAAAAEHRLEPPSSSSSSTAPGSLAVVAFTEGGRRGLRWRRRDRAFAAAAGTAAAVSGDAAGASGAPLLKVELRDLARALASDRSREARKFLFKAVT